MIGTNWPQLPLNAREALRKAQLRGVASLIGEERRELAERLDRAAALNERTAKVMGSLGRGWANAAADGFPCPTCHEGGATNWPVPVAAAPVGTITTWEAE